MTLDCSFAFVNTSIVIPWEWRSSTFLKGSLRIKSRVGDQTWQIGLQMFGRDGDGMKADLDNQEIEVELGVKYSLEE